MGLTIPDEVVNALKDVRDDTTSTDFAVVGFNETEENTLALFGKGDNGTEGLRGFLKPEDVGYALLRHTSETESAGRLKQISTRFLFIYLRPDSLPLKRKRVIGTIEGQIKKLFSPFMHSWEVAAVEEISDEKALEIVEKVSMKKNNVTTSKASALFVGGQPVKDLNYHKEKKVMQEGSRSLTTPDDVIGALAQVRKEDAPVNFAVVGYDSENPKMLALFGSGNNGIEGVKTYIKEDDICYCLLKVDFNYETVGVVKSDTTRFIYLIYRPDSLPIKRKMMVGTVEGEMKKLFSPYITNLEVDSVEKLTEELISNTIDRITMRQNKTANADATGNQTLYFSGQVVKKDEKGRDRKMMGGTPKEVQKLNFADEDGFKKSLASVRLDSDEMTWVIAEFLGERKNIQISVRATGSDGLDGLAASLDADKVQYALFRADKLVDGRSNTTKFYLIHFKPAGVASVTLAASIGVLHGAIVSAFGQHHKVFSCSTIDEIQALKV